MKIDLDKIVIEDRLRDVTPSAVRTIAESFKAIKQSVPVLVYKTATGQFRLIDGGHRVAAAKALGWTQISADVKDFDGLDEKEVEFERKMIEIDTTLARADLNAGLEADLLEQRLKVVVERNAYADTKKATREKEEADRQARETRAALREAEKAREAAKEPLTKAGTVPDKKPIGKAELNRLNTEMSRAESARVSAAKRAIGALERSSAVSDAIQNGGALPNNLHGIGKARQELALQTNRKAGTIEKAMQWFDELGRDFVRMCYGTDLDNHMQYLAMSRFKKRYDEVTAPNFKRPDTPDGRVQRACDNCIKHYWPRCVAQIERFKAGETNALPNPHAEWADTIRDEKQGFKANEEARRIETSEGQWDRVRDLTNKLTLLLGELDNAIASSSTDKRIKTKSSVVSQMRKQANELRTWAQKG